jgi:large subunit ribosomal protein L13
MDTLSYKTISVNKETAKKEWVVIDATDQVVGRLCSKVAKLLRGKYKPTFTPHVDCGDNVIIINSLSRKYYLINSSSRYFGNVQSSSATRSSSLSI